MKTTLTANKRPLHFLLHVALLWLCSTALQAAHYDFVSSGYYASPTSWLIPGWPNDYTPSVHPGPGDTVHFNYYNRLNNVSFSANAVADVAVVAGNHFNTPDTGFYLNGYTWNTNYFLVGDYNHNGSGNAYVTDGVLNTEALIVGTVHYGKFRLTNAVLSTGTTEYTVIGNSGIGEASFNSGAVYSGGKISIGHEAGSWGYAAAYSGSQILSSGEIVVGNTGTGSLFVDAGSYVSNTLSRIGYQSGSAGTVTVSGGTWNNTAAIQVGKFGSATLTVDSGLATSANDIDLGEQTGSHGVITVNGGTLNSARNLTLGYSGSATMTVNGGSVGVSGTTALGYDAGGRAALNLSSGTLSTRRVVELAGSGTLTFSGGTLQARANEGSFISGFEAGDIQINSGDAFVDSNGYTIGIANAFAGTGALNKVGTGTLTLTGSNTHSGGTVISGGVLAAGHSNAFGSGTVRVETSGTLSILSGMNPANPIELAGGVATRALAANHNLEGAITGTSDLAGIENTTLAILSGTASSATSVQASFSAGSAAINDANREGAVLHLSGVPVVDGQTTDLFVLELSMTNVAPGSYLAWLNGGNEWVIAALGNTGNNADPLTQTKYGKSFMEFQAEFGTDLSEYVGAWGFTDTSVWAVINHNSEFAIVGTVPEPSTVILVGFGLGVLALRRRARGTRRSCRDGSPGRRGCR